MPIQRSEGVLLKRQEIRETSLLVTAFTRDLGKIQGLCKGVRGARAAVPWYLEPLTLQAMVLYERRRSPWVLISGCDLLEGFEPIRRDLTRTAYALLCLEWIDAMTEPHDPHPEIFQLLCGTLTAVSFAADCRAVVCAFQAHLLRFTGLLPELESLPLTPGARRCFKELLQTGLERVGQIPWGPEGEELRIFLYRRLRSAMERELKSMRFLYAIGLETPLLGGGQMAKGQAQIAK